MTKKAATKMDGGSATSPPVPPPEAQEEVAQAEVVKRAGHIDVMAPDVRKRAEDEAARTPMPGGPQHEARKSKKP